MINRTAEPLRDEEKFAAFKIMAQRTVEVFKLDSRKITPSSDLSFGDPEVVLSDEEVSVDTSPAEKLLLVSESKSGLVGALRESSINAELPDDTLAGAGCVDERVLAVGNYLLTCAIVAPYSAKYSLKKLFVKGLVVAGADAEKATELADASLGNKSARYIFSLLYVPSDLEVPGIIRRKKSVTLDPQQFVRSILLDFHKAPTTPDLRPL